MVTVQPKSRRAELAERGRRALTLFGALQVPVLFLLFLLAPFSVYRSFPGHDLLGGMFDGMGPWDILLSTVPYVGSSWSLLFIVGLLVEGVEARRRRGEKAFLDRGSSGEIQTEALHVPRWALEFFCIPATWKQIAVFTAFTVPGLGVMVLHGERSLLASVAGACGGLFGAWVLGTLMTVPVYAACNPVEADGTRYQPIPDNPVTRIAWKWLGDNRFIRREACRLRVLATKAFKLTPFDDVVDGDLLHSDHFFALINGTCVFGLLVIGRFAFEPPEPLLGLPTLPSAALVFTLLVLVIISFGAFAFHLGQFRLSALWILILGMAGYYLTGQDHYYAVRERDSAAVRVPAVAVADVPGRGPNLVVVTTTGGGIAAAAWTTLVLERLVTERPELAHELRLVSAVSGGSVGSAFLLDELARTNDDPPAARFARAYRRAIRSSLAAVAHGLVFSDVPRLLSGGLLSLGSHDRGALIEAEWQASAERDRTLELGAFVPAIREGRAPAVIFNATVMENGRRVLVTPMNFSGVAETRDATVPQMAGPIDLPPRSQTLDEYLTGGSDRAAEVSLWTAARLSATFPYVTPAARATRDFASDRQEARHHLVDGGYYDNYGVASALEWLDLVLTEQQHRRLVTPFERVAIVQIRVGRPEDPSQVPSASGAIAALAGPLISVLSIRDGVAVTRNESELHRFIRAWNGRLGENRLRTFVFQPPAGDTYPLSWHLSQDQIDTIEKRWPEAGPPPGLREELASLTAYLKGAEVALKP